MLGSLSELAAPTRAELYVGHMAPCHRERTRKGEPGSRPAGRHGTGQADLASLIGVQEDRTPFAVSSMRTLEPQSRAIRGESGLVTETHRDRRHATAGR
jgi:hypothetical protein